MFKYYKQLWFIILTLTIISCQTKVEDFTGHRLSSKDDILFIQYKGDGDVVQFKMFEGLDLILKKNKADVFEGQLEIPDIDEAIFKYNIVVQKKDSVNKMINIDYRSSVDNNTKFQWIGKHRKDDFKKADDLEGTVNTKPMMSEYLNTEREITIYTALESNINTPIIYCTDGSVVKYYAKYVDQLITDKIISPVTLVGIHSSKENRYEEYVNNGFENKVFKNHNDFVLNEVFPFSEKAIADWDGERYLYGFSNGAAYCMYLAINHPSHFQEVIAYSTADYISEFIEPIVFDNSIKYPHFTMGAGRYESSIFKDNLRFIEKMKSHNIDVEFNEFISGHDSFVWRIEFLNYLKRTFPFSSSIKK